MTFSVTLTTSTATPKHLAFAARLKSARLRSGKSQEQIALEVGTSRRHWIRWEGGWNLPSSVFIIRIADATGQTTAFLTGEAERPENGSAPDDDEDEESDLSRALAAPISRYIADQVAKALQREALV